MTGDRGILFLKTMRQCVLDGDTASVAEMIEHWIADIEQTNNDIYENHRKWILAREIVMISVIVASAGIIGSMITIALLMHV